MVGVRVDSLVVIYRYPSRCASFLTRVFLHPVHVISSHLKLVLCVPESPRIFVTPTTHDLSAIRYL